MPYNSWRSYWNFTNSVVSKSRYIHDENTDEFLAETLKTSINRKINFPEGKTLWRSQLGSESIDVFDDENNLIGDQTIPLSIQRMYPRKSMAREGRANPKGISYLYLATDKETAMSEIRPWIGSEISLANFQLTKGVSIIDCSKNLHLKPFFFSPTDYYYEPTAEEKEEAVWAHIDNAFSRPIVDNLDEAHYAPTQILTELFKNNGFDGVMYKSMLGNGHNIVLFDQNLIKMNSCHLFEVTKIDFQFKEKANPYYCRGVGE